MASLCGWRSAYRECLITSLAEAERQVNRFPIDQHLFVQFRATGAGCTPLGPTPELLARFLPRLNELGACRAVFTYRAKKQVVFGGLAALNRQLTESWLAMTSGQVCVKQADLQLTYQLITGAHFRGSLLNVAAGWSYVERLAGCGGLKRKEAPDGVDEQQEEEGEQGQQQEEELQHQPKKKKKKSKKSKKRKKDPQVITIENDEEEDCDSALCNSSPGSQPLVIDEEECLPELLSVVEQAGQQVVVAGGSQAEEECEFVPVTAQTIHHVWEMVNRINLEHRIVAIVFHPVFEELGVKSERINELLEPLFGRLEPAQILPLTKSRQLHANLEEAYKDGAGLAKNQAYVISAEHVDPVKLLLGAKQQQLLYGTMTKSCIAMNLRRGVFLASKRALRAEGVPEHLLTLPVRREKSGEDKLLESNKSCT